MVLELALVPLVLSAASDDESEGKTDWAERFEAIDKARSVRGLPLLTPADRFQFLMGEFPKNSEYVIMGYETSRGDYHVSILRVDKDNPQTSHYFRLLGLQECPPKDARAERLLLQSYGEKLALPVRVRMK